MKIAVWLVCLLLLGFWTGGTLLLTELAGWGAQQLASGQAAAAGKTVAEWPVPGWLSVWVDTAMIQSVQEGLTWALQALDGTLPFMGSVVGWIVPLIWVLWGLGVVLLLVLAGGAHFLVARLQPAQPRAA